MDKYKKPKLEHRTYILIDLQDYLYWIVRILGGLFLKSADYIEYVKGYKLRRS